jgi:UDP-N-acetylmuramoyl-L-alanyl-D-glutamate--2,6-diaminopimelate ligase
MEAMLRADGRNAGLIGTLGTRFAGTTLPSALTTPEALELQGLLAAMVKEGVTDVAMEASSQALDLGRLNACSFSSAIFTNLSQDHLDFHGTMDAYLAAKTKLFSELVRGNRAPILINIDGEAGLTLSSSLSSRPVTYGLKAGADYVAEAVQLAATGVNFRIRHGSQSDEVFCRVPGRFSVYNALAAWAWAEECGVSPQARREALANLAVPGRFESVTDGDFQVIVDYAHTPDGLENVLTAAREITAGRLIAVFGCGGDRDRTKRPLMGAAVAKYADFAFVTSDNPRTEDPEKIIADILPGLRDFTCEKITDRRQAIVSAVRLARAGDTVVIAGKGHEDYQIIGREQFPFDDREEARQALREQKQ